MDKIDFCHCHNHGVNSMLDGMISHKDYAKRSRELGFKYIALTDHGNFDGLIKFQQACKNEDIIPISGIEGYLCKEYTKESPRGHICLWIKNQKGFKNLTRIVTISNTKGFYYKPRIDYKTLLKYHEGLIIGSACVLSFIKACNDGKKFFYDLVDLKKDDLYLEVMPHNMEIQIKHNKLIKKLSKKTNTKIIITQDTHYLNKKDWKAHEVLLAMQRKAKWSDPKRWKFPIKGFHLRSTEEMIKAAKKIDCYDPKYFTNTIEIAEKCKGFCIPKQDIELPNVPGIDPKKESETLWKLCCDGYRDIYKRNIDKDSVYHDRLKFEFEVIKSKNFIRYFLIVWELCNWCKKNDIPIGPRGSVGGSLIARCLKITSVDPIEHELIFDRFINKERQDWPDIDMDFPDNKRHLIKEHLEQIYGSNNIAHISSFARLKPRAAVQGVARVFEIPNLETNNFTKLIDDKQENPIDLAIEEHQEAKEYVEKYPKVIKYAKLLENNISHYSSHAAGLIVSLTDLEKSGRCSLMERKDIKLINWEKDDAEYVGLMKLDALGLKELTIISETVNLIKNNHNKKIILEDIDIHNEKILNDISIGNTTGIFQFNTWGITNLCKQMGIEKFKHMSDAIALYRPGPLNSGMTDEYIQRKNGKKWERKNKIYDKIVEDTYGIIVYQEQIMEVINKIGGLPYSTADLIRKIISKKRDKKEFEKYYKDFIKGCKKQGIFSKQEAIDFWEMLQAHARYSFNRSHSCCYALVAYWSAWLKTYYPTEFICCALTYSAKSKKKELIEEAYRLGLQLKLPKVNLSDPNTWVAKNNKLYIPFKEIKGIGPKKSIVASKSPEPEIKIRGRFSNKNIIRTIKHKGSLGNLLDSIGAYDEDTNIEITDDIKKLFDFRIVLDPKTNYKRLYELFDYDIKPEELDPILNGNIPKRFKNKLNFIKKKRFKPFDDLNSCNQCELYEQCTRPVHASPGKYNIMIIGECAGKQEDLYGRGFYEKAPAGKNVWRYINKFKYKREMFHISNICRCYPSKTRTPTKEQIEKCTSLWLTKEIKQIKPIVVLAFGNVNRQFWEGINTGITSISGKTIWHEKYNCWVCFCLHPASIIYNQDNILAYESGMKNFLKLCKSIGLKKLK